MILRWTTSVLLAALLFSGCVGYRNVRFESPISSIPSVRDKKDAEQAVRFAYRLLEDKQEEEAGERLLKVARSFESRDGRFEFECALTGAACFLKGGDITTGFRDCIATAREIAERKHIEIRSARARSLFFINDVLVSGGDPLSSRYLKMLPTGVRKFFLTR